MFRSERSSRFNVVETASGEMEFPRNTTILSAIAKPALIIWSANVEREACIQAAADFYEDAHGTPKMSRPAYLMSLKERIGKVRAHEKELAKAAEIGSQAHRLIERDLRKRLGQTVGPEPAVSEKAVWAYMAWQDWAKSVDLRPLKVEEKVWSLLYGYSGTLDLEAMVQDVETTVDWKTGKAIYPTEAFLQNAAYRRAIREMGHGDPKCGLIVRLPKVDTDPNFEVADVDKITAKLVGLIGPEVAESWLFEKFLHVFELWKWVEINEAAYQKSRKEKVAV